VHPNAAEFMELFAGYTRAHGIYNLTGNERPDDEGKIKGKAATVAREVTVELVSDHLVGKQGLGIIPINENNKVRFAAIDIDIYKGFDIELLNKTIQETKLPLVTCRTKSGGAHLFIFLREWTDAEFVYKRMREFASFLGYGDMEIFPKNTKILAERGDMGSWINLPYSNAPKTLRFGYDAKSKPLALEPFIKYALSRSVSENDLAAIDLSIVERLPGGPPCLQHLTTKGFPKGTRNQGLFNLGVYARKSNPDNWKQVLEEYNARFMDPPLTAEEVLGVVKSLEKKEYAYTCKAHPIQPHCNQTKCRICKFGVGGNALGLPKLGTLTKLCTEPPIWFIEVEGGGRLELSTDDLQSPTGFQHRCMEILNVMPGLPKRDSWQEIISNLLRDVVIIEVPREATPRGQLWLHLEEFCTSRVSGKTHDDLLLGKPWTSDGVTYFRLKDFMGYLDRTGFKEFKLNRVAMMLHDWGAKKQFFNVKGKGVNCYAVKEFDNKQKLAFDKGETGPSAKF
jgi:hypothetical protein